MDHASYWWLKKLRPNEKNNDYPMGDTYFYSAHRSDDGQIATIQQLDGMRPRYSVKGDWVFHISVHPEDIELAWDTIGKYMQERGFGRISVALPDRVAHCKSEIIRDANGNLIKNPELGEMITIYACSDNNGKPDLRHYDFGQELESVESWLALEGVRPGPDNPIDRKIPGALYTGYRSDKNPAPLVERMLSDRNERYKLSNEDDPYLDFKMDMRSRRALWLLNYKIQQRGLSDKIEFS